MDLEFNLPPKKMLGIGAVVVVLIYLVLGGPFFIVAPDEEGVVQFLGKYAWSYRAGN